MPFVPADSSSGFVYVPDQMRQQGKTIADDAQQLANDTKTFWQHFQQTYQTMPQTVQTNLKSFEDTNQPTFDQLMTQRIAIGHLLSGAASQMEQEDGQVKYSFYENIPLDTLIQ
jgi:hypothetical protein